jgi:hypothetical protein
MTDPLKIANTTPRFSLPLLFAAQAQKEFFVNEAFARTDALLHCAVEREVEQEPAETADGSNYLISTGATGAFEGKDGAIACRQEGQWLFIPPHDGMHLYDKSLGKERYFQGTWRAAADIPVPSGGTIVDDEARRAIEGIIAALAAAGVVSTT